MRTDLTYVRFAHPFAHAPGLFSSFRKGERKKQKLDITYTFSDSTFRFLGPEPLDATDLLVLQGLAARATASLREAKQMLHDGDAKRSALELVGDAALAPTIAVRFKLTSFIRDLGYAKSGTATLQVKDSITRLSAVTVIAKRPKFEGSFRILSGYSLDPAKGEAVVGLNPTITASVLGDTAFLRLSWAEIRQLKSDAARLLHMRLSWINPGMQRQASIDTLCAYVYPLGPEPAPDGTMRRRKLTIRRGLKELELLGWTVQEKNPDLYLVNRPRSEITRTISVRYHEQRGEIS